MYGLKRDAGNSPSGRRLLAAGGPVRCRGGNASLTNRPRESYGWALPLPSEPDSGFSRNLAILSSTAETSR